MDDEARVKWLFCRCPQSPRLLRYATWHEQSHRAWLVWTWVLHNCPMVEPHDDYFCSAWAVGPTEPASNGCREQAPHWPWLSDPATKADSNARSRRGLLRCGLVRGHHQGQRHRQAWPRRRSETILDRPSLDSSVRLRRSWGGAPNQDRRSSWQLVSQGRNRRWLDRRAHTNDDQQGHSTWPVASTCCSRDATTSSICCTAAAEPNFSRIASQRALTSGDEDHRSARTQTVGFRRVLRGAGLRR